MEGGQGVSLSLFLLRTFHVVTLDSVPSRNHSCHPAVDILLSWLLPSFIIHSFTHLLIQQIHSLPEEELMCRLGLKQYRLRAHYVLGTMPVVREMALSSPPYLDTKAMCPFQCDRKSFLARCVCICVTRPGPSSRSRLCAVLTPARAPSPPAHPAGHFSNLPLLISHPKEDSDLVGWMSPSAALPGVRFREHEPPHLPPPITLTRWETCPHSCGYRFSSSLSLPLPCKPSPL